MSERDDLREQAFHTPVVTTPTEREQYKGEVLGEWVNPEPRELVQLDVDGAGNPVWGYAEGDGS